jgi:hypothetical protein
MARVRDAGVDEPRVVSRRRLSADENAVDFGGVTRVARAREVVFRRGGVDVECVCRCRVGE